MDNMFKIIKMFKYFVILVGLTRAAVLPVDKCKLEDTSCLVPAFQKALPYFVKGIPELGVEVLDVMEMDDVMFDLNGLQFTLKDGRLKGLKDSIINNVSWDTKAQKINVVYHTDCTIKGHYIAGGRILILPITGDGQMKLKLNNLEISLVIDYVMEKGADGKNHVSPKFNYEFDLKDSAHFNLTNLFNGNKELSDTMLTFLNENSKQISVEFGKPLMDVAARKIFKSIKSFFEKVPIEDIAVV